MKLFILYRYIVRSAIYCHIVVNTNLINTQMDSNPGYALTVTGHSLGASLASLALESLVGVGVNITTYTSGQTRTGNPAYADYIDQILLFGKIFRSAPSCAVASLNCVLYSSRFALLSEISLLSRVAYLSLRACPCNLS